MALTAELVTPRIRGRFGVPYLWHESCSSTQDVLRGSGLPEGAVAVAEHQRAGRGRSGRRWDAGRRRAVLVSIADKVHNARAIVTDLQRTGATVLDKFNGEAGEILTYYVECLRIGQDKQVPEELLWPLYTAVLEIDEFVMGGTR